MKFDQIKPFYQHYKSNSWDEKYLFGEKKLSSVGTLTICNDSKYDWFESQQTVSNEIKRITAVAIKYEQQWMICGNLMKPFINLKIFETKTTFGQTFGQFNRCT